jgi:PAS domain S-box-containing protein
MRELQSFISDEPIAAAMFDRDMRYVAFSPRWLTDHRIERIALGDSHYVVFPEIPERWKEVHRRALAGETLRATADRFERANGEIVWLNWEVRPWRDRRVEIGGVVIFTEDVTERIETEMALKNALARLRLAQSAAQIGVWDWDIPANRTFLSDEWYALLGLEKREELSFHSFLARVHPEDRALVDDVTRRALAGEGGIGMDYRIIRLDNGETRWISSKGEVAFDEDGAPLRAMGAIFDITERKEMERTLREASQRKSEFVAMLAHELRNPLAPISNALNALERMTDGARDEKKAALLEMALRQVDYLLRLTDDLLDIERVEHGKIRIDKTHVDLADVIERAAELSRPGVMAKGQTLDIFAETALAVAGDPVRLTQIFANLIDNASRYSDKGARIDVFARTEGADAVVSVKDEGVGIPAEMLTSIFDLFTQYPGDGAPRSGLGVGLALAQRLVAAHGGEIAARSEGAGHGSEFVVRLPRAG